MTVLQCLIMSGGIPSLTCALISCGHTVDDLAELIQSWLGVEPIHGMLTLDHVDDIMSWVDRVSFYLTLHHSVDPYL